MPSAHMCGASRSLSNRGGFPHVFPRDEELQDMGEMMRVNGLVQTNRINVLWIYGLNDVH